MGTNSIYIDLILSAAIAAGLTLALLLGFAKRKDLVANRFLSLSLVAIVSWVTWALGIDIRMNTHFAWWNRLPVHFSLAIGPLVYFYVLKKTRPGSKFNWKHLLHFIPLLLEEGVFIFQSGVDDKTIAFAQLNLLTHCLAAISILIYCHLSRKLMQRYQKRLRGSLRYKSRYGLQWLRRVLAVFGILWLMSIAYIAINYFYYRHEPGLHAYYLLYLLSAMLLIRVGAAAFLKPEPEPQVVSSIVPKSLPSAELQQKGAWLKKVVGGEQLYQDPELTVSSLAEILEMPAYELSRIINLAIGKNFSDFINEYRIKDVTTKMKDPAYDRITLLGIAYDSGFNSKSTFNRTFREMTGKTPAEFKNNLKKEFPISELRPYSPRAAIISFHETVPKWSEKKFNRNIMFRNYFKIAWRNMIRDRQFTVLNLVGLSTGLACTFLIYLWINHETSMDNFQDDGLYEVMQNVPLADKSLMTIESTPDMLAKALKDEVSGIADAATFKISGYDEETAIVSDGGNKSFKAAEAFASDNFFRMFAFKMLYGDGGKALKEMKGVLLSDQLAAKLFNSPKNAIGQTVTWYKGLNEKMNGSYTVSGVFVTPPANSTRQFDVLFPNSRYVATSSQSINWNSSDPGTYIVLNKGVNPEQISQKIKDFIRKKTGDTVWTGTLFLQRFKDIYLHNHYENGIQAGGRVSYVRLFSIVAIFLLTIACINFMNLSTAKASVRLKEVGIKKVVGAGRGLLILQYLGESVLMALTAMVVAAVLVVILLPYFEDLTGASLRTSFEPKIIGVLLLVTLITGLIAGSYPALYLSGFKPALILKGTLNLGTGNSITRKGLVAFQFCVSAILIIGVLVVYRQMQFIQARNLGYNKDNVITIKNEGNIQKDLHAFITEMQNIPGVVNVSDMEGDLFSNHSGGGGIDWPGKTNRIEFSGFYVDFNFTQTVGLQLTEGRTFSSAIPADSNAVIFNETAIRQMGLKNPIGTVVKLWGSPKTIIGVARDFHYESLYKNIGPLFISFGKNNQNIIARVSANAEKETIAKIGALYGKYNHGLPFEYKFLDEDYHALYAAEQRVTVLSEWFAGIAILISCLGLFGLSAFIVQRRRKEISIRKVVGASVSNLATMLSVDFIRLVLIAFLFAVPLAWYALDRWLQTFAYHIKLDAATFLVPGIVVIVVAIATVSFQTIKGAFANPADNLRSE